jgi:4-cresol dehydrogenase (hydroxylating)
VAHETGRGSGLHDAAALAAYQMNTSEFWPREIIAILRPASVEDVRRVIAVARATGVPVHPISTGRNWAFGSALPARERAALVDLGGMNRVREVSQRFRYAVIEPGVTQGQLSDHLSALGGTLALNVTGAGPHTSIIGNVLDRGGGNRGPRADDLLGAEVVLGNGEVVRTGLWHLDCGDAAYCYPPGLGPDLRGLVVQSAFGIVTQMAVRLHRAAPFLELTAEVPEHALAGFIDALRLARDDGLITGYARIADGRDRHIRLFAPTNGPAAWTAQLIVRGISTIRAAAGRELERRLRDLAGRIVTFDVEHDNLAKVPDEERPLLEARVSLQHGIPSDRSLEAIAATAGKTLTGGGPALIDRDRDLPGFLAVNVVLPFSGDQAAECAAIVTAAAAEAGVATARQLGVLSDTALSGFFPFWFDRRDASEVMRAHCFKDTLLGRLERAGIYPMRMDIDAIGTFITRHDSGYWRAVATIGEALDPDGIISGRYAPPRTRTVPREDGP